MAAKTYKFCGNVQILRPVIDAWIDSCNIDEMGISLDEKVYMADLKKLVDNPDSDLLVIENEGEITGFMGLQIFDSPLGKQRLANEHFWYVVPEHRGISGIRLLRAAIEWAREKGCSHVVLNASYMASDLHDRVCKLYATFGARKFETSYLLEL